MGKSGATIKSVTEDREVDIQFDEAVGGTWVPTRISGKKEDCLAVCQEITQMLRGYDVVSLHISSSQAGLIIGKGGSTIKALKAGLQTREDTKSNPWTISGPRADVTELVRRIQGKFSVSVLGGLDTCRYACPGCVEDFPDLKGLLRHTQRHACRARSCVSGCGAYYSDEASCLKHQACCPSVRRCPGCEMGFETEAELTKHVAAKACRARACRGCRKIFTNIPEAELHEQTCDRYAAACLHQLINICTGWCRTRSQPARLACSFLQGKDEGHGGRNVNATSAQSWTCPYGYTGVRALHRLDLIRMEMQ